MWKQGVLVFFAHVEMSLMVLSLATAMEQAGSSQEPCIKRIIWGITKKQSMADWLPIHSVATTIDRES